jgi:hypothetical protein
VRATLGRFAARYGLLVPLLGGALLLALAEFLTLWEIRVITAVPEDGSSTGGSHHGYALLLVALALVPMSIGAVIGGSRPAALACLVLSLVAVVVVLAVDLPDVNETGLIGQTYEAAEARPGAGFYLESLGAALALVGSVAVLVLGGRSERGRPARRRRPTDRAASPAADAATAPGGDAAGKEETPAARRAAERARRATPGGKPATRGTASRRK